LKGAFCIRAPKDTHKIPQEEKQHEHMKKPGFPKSALEQYGSHPKYSHDQTNQFGDRTES
jgi:hypothetical protein